MNSCSTDSFRTAATEFRIYRGLGFGGFRAYRVFEVYKGLGFIGFRVYKGLGFMGFIRA